MPKIVWDYKQNIRSVQCSNMLFSYKLSRSLTHPLGQQKVNPMSRSDHNDVIQHQQTFLFFFWPCSIASFLSVWLCIWELQKPRTRLHAVVNLPLWDHTAGNQGSPTYSVLFIIFDSQHCWEKKFFFLTRIWKLKCFFFFFHHLHQPHGNEKSGPCLATGVLSECGGHVGSVCLVYLLFLFLFLILEFLFLSCIKGLSVKSPL